MLTAHRITKDHIGETRSIYERFSGKARSDYRWTHDPIPFEAFGQAIATGLLEGYRVDEDATGEAVALMLYRMEEHRAIEINVIHTETDALKSLLDCLMRTFIVDIRTREGWDVVSYAMPGQQEQLIRMLPWYGFKPVGQAVVGFDLLDAISIQILQQQTPKLPDASCRLDTWRPEYAGGVAECIFAAFSGASDARWDPRFRTLRGARRVVGLTTAGLMGAFLPACTMVVLRDEKPVGFCFLIQDGTISGNIPLIGVHPSEAGRGLGNVLLQACLMRCIEDVVSEKLDILRISATTDTDNIPAIKMYRRMGFREEYNYPHAYLTREKAQVFQPGKWC